MMEGEKGTIGGNIIIAVNGTRIINLDGLTTYLEENTLPDQTITVTVLRDNQTVDLTIKMGKRPASGAA